MESANEAILPSFDKVVSKLKPLMDGTDGVHEIIIKGISSDIVGQLQAKSSASELPGWEGLRYVCWISMVYGTSDCIKGSISLEIY